MSKSKKVKSNLKRGTAPKTKTQAASNYSYGAVKSKNEIYFQMASVFRAVSRNEKKLAGEWMARILTSSKSDIAGKKAVNVL